MEIDSHQHLTQQASFPGLCPVQEAIEALSNAANTEELGAVFTKGEIVGFILDLVGYTADKRLYEKRLLEPSFGNGDFLLVAISRLLKSYRDHPRFHDRHIGLLKNAIRGVELHKSTYWATRTKIAGLLDQYDFPPDERGVLLDSWLQQGDYLLLPLNGTFTHVVGNPPYVRQELIPDALVAEYRRRYTTIFDRADLYVPFIERSLRLLSPGGSLGFICADRWMKNRYGGPLRRLVAEEFHLRLIVDMVGKPAFHSDVTAYPAITVIDKAKPGPTRIAYRPDVLTERLDKLVNELAATGDIVSDSVPEISIVGKGDSPWLLGEPAHLALIHRLEANYPTLEQAGCRVGIGVATGADKIFIGKHDQFDVEPDRQLPLAMARDILTGEVEWQGYSVINPFAPNGQLVSLDDYPKLARYLEVHRTVLSNRHVAKNKSAGAWYRTIDKITAGLAAQPKLLIPDIKGDAHVVYEEGKLYPHHNLYYIVAADWDLKALQTVLLSGVARLFVATYSTKMRGDYLRFQAQYLRRIRIPYWNAIPERIKAEFIAASGKDTAARNRVVAKLYNLTKEEEAIIFK